MSEPLLSVKNLEVTYFSSPTSAVKGISFDIQPASCLAIVGESGSGKSTTALAIARLLVNSADTKASAILFEGNDILEASKKELRKLRKNRIGIVFQDPIASWNLSRKVGTQLLDAFEKSERAERREKLISYMGKVGIDKASEVIDMYPYMLSGGMMQRAMIAGALLGNPALLIADEPTSALDVTVQADLLNLLSELRKEQGLAMLLVSHNLAVVNQIAERTVVMYSGEIIEEGPTSTLINSAKHPYTVNVTLYTNEIRNASSQGCVYANRCPLVIPLCNSQKPVLQLIGETKVACHRHAEVAKLLEVPNGAITSNS
jgi:ABC-type dipeptide/oligopeptide/nickel transport system ATPase component